MSGVDRRRGQFCLMRSVSDRLETGLARGVALVWRGGDETDQPPAVWRADQPPLAAAGSLSSGAVEVAASFSDGGSDVSSAARSRSHGSRYRLAALVS